MKLALLTSDSIDARIVFQELINSKRDIRAVIYEEARMSLKSKVRLLSLVLSRKLKGLNFRNLAGRYKDVVIERTTDINSQETLVLLEKTQPELLIVVGTKRLDKKIFNAAPKGAINLHSGILPFYRGSDSEFWALHESHPEMIGITIHFIDQGLDSGDIILKECQSINPKDSIGTLRIKNIFLGVSKINEAVSLIESGAYPRIKQNISLAKSYPAAPQRELKRLNNRRREWLKRGAGLKTFGNDHISAQEEVCVRPLIESMDGLEVDWPSIFCIRIDADEFDRSNFDRYLAVFRKYPGALTVFFNMYSFRNAQDKIKECMGMGLDIQSHGFYHHTYNDYKSNRYNIKKAKDALEKLGIKTKGFTAPMGRYNMNLMRALEDEGYEYSSDFAYDYLGLPSYPCIGKRLSQVLEVPVFPLAPELFLRQGKYSFSEIFNYYKAAIDQMCDCGLPALIYAHNSSFADHPGLLNDILDYTILEKGLTGVSMTAFNDWWRKKGSGRADFPVRSKILKTPAPEFLGSKAGLSLGKKIKVRISRILDFERITPENELCCPQPQKGIKVLLRKIC